MNRLPSSLLGWFLARKSTALPKSLVGLSAAFSSTSSTARLPIISCPMLSSTSMAGSMLHTPFSAKRLRRSCTNESMVPMGAPGRSRKWFVQNFSSLSGADAFSFSMASRMRVRSWAPALRVNVITAKCSSFSVWFSINAFSNKPTSMVVLPEPATALISRNPSVRSAWRCWRFMPRNVMVS